MLLQDMVKGHELLNSLGIHFTGWYKPFMPEVDNLIYQMGNVGDELLEINGNSTEGMGHVDAITIIKHGGDIVKLTVKRLPESLSGPAQNCPGNGSANIFSLQWELKSDNDLRVVKLTDRDDIEAYLTTFERLMTAYNIPLNKWIFKLAPQLTGKAQQAYAALTEEDALICDTVKAAILRCYNITEETYRHHFQSAVRSNEETQWYLSDLATKWLKGERKPNTALEVEQLADDYLEARKQTAKDDQTGKPCLPVPDTKSDRSQHDTEEGETSHPLEKRPFRLGRGMETTFQPSPATTRAGLVEGRKVNDIVLDTGCSKTLVHHDLVLQKKLLPGEAVTIQCAHGDNVLYPVANVNLVVDGVPLVVESAVSKSLPVSVLLGTDVPELARKQEEEDEIQLQKEEDSQVNPNPVMSEPVDTQAATDCGSEMECAKDVTLDGCMLDDSLFSGGKSRPKLTRSQKRYQRSHHTQMLKTGALDISSEELQKLQKKDPSFEKLSVGEGKSETHFYDFEGDVMQSQQWTSLCYPHSVGKAVPQLAHEVARHLGKHKTAKRILHRFYWPTLYRDVEDFCRSCQVCQKSSKQKVVKAPLIPLPVVTEQFRRVAMDIVGPLPRTKSGNRIILVMCDYATRYPGQSQSRQSMLSILQRNWSGYLHVLAYQNEILTDQGSNFTSQLLSEIYQLLHVHPIRTTPYHPQKDGLVERFNKTLKAMLQKVAVEDHLNCETSGCQLAISTLRISGSPSRLHWILAI
ncbi:hypothetical protein EMCRGX_G003357 [Ephydatia muelleri]